MLSRSPFSSLTILEHQSRLGPSELSELSERSDPSEQSQSLQSESDEVLTSVKPGFKTHRSSKSQPSITVESNLPERQATRMRSNSYLDRLRPLSAMSFPSRFPTRNNSLESPNSSGRSTPTSVFDFNPGKVLDYGEVQTSNAGWRRTSEFFVLTESYILRYRNEKKAAADFSMLVPTSSHMRHRRGSQSASSLQGMLQSSSTDSPSELSGEKLNRIPLVDIISVQVMKDGDSRVTIEVTWLPQAALHASNLAIQLDRENGKPHFLENLSDLARQNIIRQDAFLSQAHLRVVHDALEASKESVSEIDSYNIHKVVRRRANLAKGSAQLSLDDLATKDPPVVAFLVLSNHKIHFIPLSKNSRKACGVVTLRHAIVSSRDDSFDLIFRYVLVPGSLHDIDQLQCYVALVLQLCF